MYKKIMLVLLMCGVYSQNIQANDTEDLVNTIAKGTAGALIGGGICYWLSQYCQSDLIAEHELKMKFLDDLILFIQSSIYSQGDSLRVFTHYYNALNQFVQSTRSVEIDLLHEFADCRSDFERELLLHKVQDIQVQLQATHESNIKIGRYILAVVGAFVGGLIPFAGQEHENPCGCGHHHSTTYVGNFARAAAPANIFSRK